VKGRIWAAVSAVHDLPRPKMWRGRDPKTFRGGVVASDDGGRTWTPSVQGMEQTAATHILLDPNSPTAARTLYVCGFGKGVYKSTDGGRSWASRTTAWKAVNLSPGGSSRTRRASCISWWSAAAPTAASEPVDGALYRSSDGAEHWEKLALPPDCNAPNGLAIDPADPARLYLAAWGRRGTAAGDAGGGIFLSTDAGKRWKSVLDKDQHIFDVTLDARTPNVLYATGFESSVWKSVNRGESWLRLNGYNFKWGQRVFADPVKHEDDLRCTYGGCIWHGPADGDPDAMEDIVTPDREAWTIESSLLWDHE
jgi:photosystem II stability/assembly factor-like uncharacterized protein